VAQGSQLHCSQEIVSIPRPQFRVDQLRVGPLNSCTFGARKGVVSGCQPAVKMEA